MSDDHLLAAGFVRLDDHDPVGTGFLANHCREFAQEQFPRRYRLSQAQRQQLNDGFALSKLMRRRFIEFPRSFFRATQIETRAQLAKDIHCP